MIPLTQAVAKELEAQVTDYLTIETDKAAENASPEQVADQSFLKELTLLYKVQAKVQEATEGKETFLSLAEFNLLASITR